MSDAAAAFGEDLVRLLADRGRHGSARPVRIIVLGDRSRGDDAVAYLAVRDALAGLPDAVLARLDVRETGQLDPADLVEIPDGGFALVVDAVAGVPAGEVVRLPLGEVAPAAEGGPVPRSSHVLPVDQLVALAGVLRGGDPPGVLLGVGAERFGFGEPLSPAVADAIPALAAAIRAELAHLGSEIPAAG
ncbi:MAG TPA: hydrogenase maturation protease [Candidatus Dormibacteraeota bacterium]|nr:hydrogenase maturation protease [Candidatus Dormibacteraeota bacterium]